MSVCMVVATEYLPWPLTSYFPLCRSTKLNSAMLLFLRGLDCACSAGEGEVQTIESAAWLQRRWERSMRVSCTNASTMLADMRGQPPEERLALVVSVRKSIFQLPKPSFL